MTTIGSVQLRKRYRLATRAVVAATLFCLVFAVWFAREWAGDRAYRELSAAAEESLSLQIEALAGVMEKYRLIPPLLSRRADIRALFETPAVEDGEAVRRLLMRVAAASGARDVAIAAIDGTVLASARGFATTGTLAPARLHLATAQRRLGRAPLRLSDGSRAYAFAAHVPGREAGTNAGMVVVLVPFDAIEANWSLSSNPILVTDAREFVFLSNRAEWVGKPWKASDAAPGVEPLSFVSGRFFRVPESGNSEYVAASRDIPILGWTMHVLADSAPFARARRNAAMLAALAVVLAGLTANLYLARQEMAQARIRREKAQALRLERLVRERTAELSNVNEVLRGEIEVRRETEKRLRDTQNELVHAAKLAVIGQMSATLSHEYNQPLAAIKTYASNAATMIERGRTAAAHEVLARIGRMVDRMSTLSRTLLAFSRKPGTELEPVSVETVVSEALVIVGQKARKAGVAVETDIEPGLVVHSGRIRLSQVLVNLVGNAIDALCGDGPEAPAGSRVCIAAHHASGRVHIAVSDNGPGIDPALRENVFEPFFTTKPAGAGLGLGLSIVESIVRDLQGSVRLEDRDGEIGACFVIDLPATREEAEAAE
ncbi:sensor histidine kinase [Oricola thermophila]|uniref:C4-dicarboxylate transport sensor protein DctB n=1 Tax=Oricola thermophila TaxID=2742145 RepID=A0A6N1VHV3_9HYPH|nr:ATP-binding protein [Oricola thermophila]QKV20334.1 sensor histidine kinase [Oricola thermophila]